MSSPPPKAATGSPAAVTASPPAAAADHAAPRMGDVLCGRGGGTNHHIGNNHWRALVCANKRLYLTLPKKQKALVAKSIVHAIRSHKPPGRFLQKSDDGSWHDIGDRRACEKTSQALREGAPEIRTEMRDEKTNGFGLMTRPGQILPNGLIALDYEGVEMMDEHDQAVYTGQDGVISKDKKGYRMKAIKPSAEGAAVAPQLHLPNQTTQVSMSDVSMMQAFQQPHSNQTTAQMSMSELSMMQAFQQFQAGLLPHQQQEQQQKMGVPTSISAPSVSASPVPQLQGSGNTMPATAMPPLPQPLPAQQGTSEVATASQTPAAAAVQPAAQEAVEGLNGVGVGLYPQPPLELQQCMLHQSAPPLRSDGANAFHQRAILLQQQLAQQSALGGHSIHQSQNIHTTPYDMAAELVMREKILAARQKAAFTEARLQNLQQIHHLRQHAYHQQGLQGSGITPSAFGHHHAFDGMAAASLGQHYAFNGMTAAAGGGQHHVLNGTASVTGLGQHALLQTNGTTLANTVLGGAPRFALPPELKNSESTASELFPGVARGDSLSSEGLMNLRRRIEASALAGIPPTTLNNTESISSLRDSLSPEELMNLRNKMEASAVPTLPATSLNNTDSISSLPPELWAIMSRRESRSIDDTMDSAVARLGAAGGGGDAVNGLGCAGANGASRLPSMPNGTLPSSTTLSHLRMADMWHKQRTHLANLSVPPECAGFGVVDVFGPRLNAEPTDLDRQSSMDHLLRAARMASEDNEASDEDQDNLTMRQEYNLSKKKVDSKPRVASNPAWEYMKLASQKAKQLKPGRNDSSLMDDSDDDIPKIITGASLKRMSPSPDAENRKEFSKERKQLKPGKDDTSLSKDSKSGIDAKPSSKRKRDPEKEDASRKEGKNSPAERKPKNTSTGKSLSSNQSTLSTELSVPVASAIPQRSIGRTHSQLMAVANICHPTLPNAGPSTALLQEAQDNLPLQETAFLSGPSLTLSEVSWGRDISFSGVLKSAGEAEDVDDGQFDDPEDED